MKYLIIAILLIQSSLFAQLQHVTDWYVKEDPLNHCNTLVPTHIELSITTQGYDGIGFYNMEITQGMYGISANGFNSYNSPLINGTSTVKSNDFKINSYGNYKVELCDPNLSCESKNFVISCDTAQEVGKMDVQYLKVMPDTPMVNEDFVIEWGFAVTHNICNIQDNRLYRDSELIANNPVLNEFDVTENLPAGTYNYKIEAYGYNCEVNIVSKSFTVVVIDTNAIIPPEDTIIIPEDTVIVPNDTTTIVNIQKLPQFINSINKNTYYLINGRKSHDVYSRKMIRYIKPKRTLK